MIRAHVPVSDDTITSYSAYGVATEGYSKPEIVAPGTDIIAPLPHNKQLTLSILRPENRVDNNYFRMSGTSMAAPMVSGAVAILLQDEPHLTPDQVKFRLMETAAKADRWPAYDPERAGAGTSTSTQLSTARAPPAPIQACPSVSFSRPGRTP
jgi:Subtilase family.